MSNRSIEFNYLTTGARKKGPLALVLLHGFLGSAEDWLPIMEQLGDSRYTIAIDLPGHGTTKVNGGDDLYRMERTTEQLIEWLDSNEIEKADLVGYSMGGRLALYLLVNFPDRFGKCILESTSPGLESADDRSARIDHDDRVAEQLLSQPLEKFLIDWYNQPIFHSLKKRPALIEKLVRVRKDGNAIELARALRGMSTGRQPSLWDDLHRIRADVRLIVGAEDHKFVSIAQLMQKRNERINLSIVENCGHNIHLEQPGCFFDILNEFLNIEENR